MTYTPPTTTEFKARYPEFEHVANERVQLFLDEAGLELNDGWIETDRKIAHMALTAHMLSMEGEPGRSSGSGDSSAAGQLAKKHKVGDVEVEFITPQEWGVGDGGTFAGYEVTVYGRRFWELKARNFPTVQVV